MIAVRNCLVTAAGAMDVAGIMTAAAMVRSAAIGVVAGYADHVLVDMIFTRMVKAGLVQGLSTSRPGSPAARVEAR